MTARYALGVLALEQIRRRPNGDYILENERLHFAVRVDFPDPSQDIENRGHLTLRKIHPTPSVNLQEDEVLIRDFDNLSGRIWFSVHSDTGVSDLIVDYISHRVR